MLKQSLFAATALLLIGIVANAQTTGGGTLQLSGELQPSIVLVFHQNTSGGIQLTAGDGSSAAAAALTTVSMYGTANGPVGSTNFIKTQQSDGFTLTGTFNVEVDAANVGSSTTYSLQAALQSSDNATYTLGGTPITNGIPTTVPGGPFTYAVQQVHTIAIKFPSSMGSGAVGNTIIFTATTI